MDVIKIATAGSVDDGKSTLIGRILYDTGSLTDDKITQIEEKSRAMGFDYLDFSLATDGLMAEREQGITIDVAHIYFSYQNKSFIIADSPGHVEYTRNMVTGASNSDMSIVLVDARKGVVEQTYRHLFINNLLGIKYIIVAINKMDLVDYDQQAYLDIKSEIETLLGRGEQKDRQVVFVPVSALKGQNLLEKSEKMPWYNGATLMSYMETFSEFNSEDEQLMRYPVQHVIRPKTEEYHDFRAFSGKVYGSQIQVGDAVRVLPSEKTSTVKAIHSDMKAFDLAKKGASVSIELTDEVQVSRGDMIVKQGEEPTVSKEIKAKICWMDQDALSVGGKYYLQHNTNTVLAKVVDIQGELKSDFSGLDPQVDHLDLNQIGYVNLKLNKALCYDSFSTHKQNGSFILIDSKTNTTAGVGFIA
ncbi:MAG: sulfate adenylyltransferase subunit 1 [Flavobacteriaceae bacterium]